MKYCLKYLVVLFFVSSFFSQNLLFSQVKVNDSKFRNTYYDIRRAAYDQEGMAEGSVVFLGNSITEQGWWNMLFKSTNIVNRGIGGDNTYGIIDRLPDILSANPEKIFLMAGINDISLDFPLDTIVNNIKYIIIQTKEKAPKCKFYLQSVLPLNDNRLAYPKVKGKNPQVRELNVKLKELCVSEGVTYLDIASLLSDEKGDLQLSLTKDGIHIYPQAYEIWAAYLKKSGLLK